MRSWLRRVLFQIHLWAGLATGLYALVIGISGSILVFHEDYQDYQIARRARLPAPAPRDSWQSFEQWIAAARAATGHSGAVTVEPPQRPDQAAQIHYFSNRAMHYVFLDPATSQVLGRYSPQGSWMLWLHQLHNNFFAGRTGRLWNGIGALAVLLLAMTGLYLWLVGNGRWQRRLWIDGKASWRRINWDLHHAVGFWSFLPVVLLCVTGAFFTWPRWFRWVVGTFAPVTEAAPLRVSSGAGQARLPLAQLVAAGDAAIPLRPAYRILVPAPGARQEPLRVLKRGDGEPFYRTVLTAHIDPYTGNLLRVDGWHQRKTGDKILAWIPPLHTGHFGGLPLKIGYAVAGLALPALFFSGFLMWWLRVVRKRLEEFS